MTEYSIANSKLLRRLLLKYFPIGMIVITPLAMFNYSWGNAILVGLGLSLFMILQIFLKSWFEDLKRANILKKFTKNALFEEMNFEIMNKFMIRGKVNDHIVELIPWVRKYSRINFELIIDFSTKQHLLNALNIQNAIGEHDFYNYDNQLTITEWTSRNRQNDFRKIITEIKEIISKIEGEQATTMPKTSG